MRWVSTLRHPNDSETVPRTAYTPPTTEREVACDAGEVHGVEPGAFEVDEAPKAHPLALGGRGFFDRHQMTDDGDDVANALGEVAGEHAAADDGFGVSGQQQKGRTEGEAQQLPLVEGVRRAARRRAAAGRRCAAWVGRRVRRCRRRMRAGSARLPVRSSATWAGLDPARAVLEPPWASAASRKWASHNSTCLVAPVNRSAPTRIRMVSCSSDGATRSTRSTREVKGPPSARGLVQGRRRWRG